jgi:PAS domain S-box-containing protein
MLSGFRRFIGMENMSRPGVANALEQPGQSPQSDQLFRLLVESVRDCAIFVLSPEGHVLTWNLGAKALKGYEKEEIIGQHFSKFYLPEAAESGWPSRELALAEKEERFSDEGWRVRKDGSSFWASVIITALRDPTGKLTGFAKITQDMSERRQAAERIQNLNRELRSKVSQLDESQRIIELKTLELQNLSARVLQIQDEERRRIARELHDDLGQQLAGLRMLLNKSQHPEAAKMADSAISTVRNLSYLLHPPLLDEAGLRAAVHWFVEGLTQRSNVQISLTIRPQAFPRLDEEVETAIFRVVQESLTNVVRHSNSESARVEIDKQSESVVVRVRDYGVGLALNLASPSGWMKMGVGIAGMRERVRQFGGDLTVSRSDPGTLVEAKIPLFG